MTSLDFMELVGVLRGRGWLGYDGCFGTKINEKRHLVNFLGEFQLLIDREKKTMNGFFCSRIKSQLLLSNKNSTRLKNGHPYLSTTLGEEVEDPLWKKTRWGKKS